MWGKNGTWGRLSGSGKHDCYPLAVKAEATLDSQSGAEDGSAALGSTNSNITQAVFEKDKVESDFDGNDLGKECVICLSEPRNTTVLPCRHMFVTGKDRRNNTSRVTKIFQHAISVDLILIEMASGPILPMDVKRSRDDNDPNDIL
ncbi:hypothetical protein T459_10302 [Capsicum annuum]|uniref:RING-type E3 ubiquitin transferase n=1 Tax=Capsicum annuum TaxID=4072 RepID=A0A2G3A1W8_CAPAN|nr:hypothetical protein T459_10302 [Capsicum annuum]